MNNREIGRIISITAENILAEIYNFSTNYLNADGYTYFIGEVGSYISIYDIGRTIIGEIVAIHHYPDQQKTEYNTPDYNRQVTINLIGEIRQNKFFFGVTKMPFIFSPIHIVSKTDLSIMLEVSKSEETVKDKNTRLLLLPIGKSVLFPDFPVKVNIDHFFGFHFAVFGNTGAGKSNTIAKLIQTIFSKKNYSAKGARFVIIDSNGEYTQAFSELSHNSDISIKILQTDSQKNKIEIPVWALSVEDWALLLHASERTQLPVLKRALDIAKNFRTSKDKDNRIKNHILASTLIGIFNSSDSSPSKKDKVVSILQSFNTSEINLTVKIPVDGAEEDLQTLLTVKFGTIDKLKDILQFLHSFQISSSESLLSNKDYVPFSLNDFIEAVNFATLYEGSVSSQRIQEYTATLLTRLQSLQSSEAGNILVKTEFKNLDEYINALLGTNQVLNVDISSLDDSAGEVVIKVLAKILLDYLRKQKIKAERPINFIIEEAHRFIKDGVTYPVLGYNIFERIAKEGRKYGLLLGISSQRPKELSGTVVSQCSNFIIHRIQNPDDLSYISRMVPFINRNTIERLTYLQTGHALVFGTAINLPTVTQFELANPKTDSDNAKISEKWYIP